MGKLKLAFTAVSLQIFRFFYRPDGGNIKGKFSENFQKSTPQKLFWGIKLKLCRIVSNNSLYKNIFFFLFIAVAQALWLLWQLKVSIDLQWEK